MIHFAVDILEYFEYLEFQNTAAAHNSKHV